MAHMLTVANGRAAMAYVGAKPWHGLGQELTVGATIEEWLVQAGMNYKVCRSRVRFGDNDKPQVWDERHVLFRSDTKKPLSVVSDGYQIVQPNQVLEFFRDLCSQHNFTLETAGTLYEGARYWALAKLPVDFALRGVDKVSGYALLATSCDGSIATTGQVTSIRVVCNNTLTASLGSKAQAAIKVKHSTRFDETKAKVDLGLLATQWVEFKEAAEKLAAKRMSRREALSALIDVMGDPELPVEKQPNQRPMAEILRLYEGRAIGSDMASANGTAWGLLNAATEYYDHHAGRSANTRLASAWFGRNAETKTTLFQQLLAKSA